MTTSRSRFVGAAGLLAAAIACATNPATGKRELMLVSEGQEAALGREAAEQAAETYGLYPDQQVQAYVARLGAQLAARSERPGLPWSFRVVDDPAVNAFALPGGYIFATRGLMTYLDSEAQLAAVLGHEIGHVTARHSASQISRAQLAGLGLGIGMILRPELQRFGGLAESGVGLLFLKFGRDDEREADSLGLRYMTREQYDPREMIEVFETLDRVGDEAGGPALPSWLSTHPSPEDRIERIRSAAAEAAVRAGRVNREAYLRRIDGMIYGPNPREGFFRDATFYQPELRFKMEFPRGWASQNERRAVLATSPSRDAAVVVTLAEGRSAAAAAQAFFSQRGLRAARARRTTINGLEALTAPFEADVEGGRLAGLAAFVELDGKPYRLLGYAPAARWDDHEAAVSRSLASFERLTERRYLEVQPKRIQVVTVQRDMPLREFAQRYPSSVPLKALAVLNDKEEQAHIRAGELTKRVVGGDLPE